MFAFRITTLPREYRTETQVIALVERVLEWGTIKSVKINQFTAKNGAKYCSAIVSMQSWNENCRTVLSDAETTGRHTVTFQPDTGLSHTWDNGKPMTHISFSFFDEKESDDIVETQQRVTKTLEIEEGEWSSLHIPIIPNGLRVSLKNGLVEFINEHSLKAFIEDKLRLGKVKRIDFVDRDDLPMKPFVKAAFIHFESWYDNKNVAFLRRQLNTEGRFRQKGFYDGSELRKFFVESATGEGDSDAYFVFKINHRPIPDADACGLNIHQLAAINAKLTATVENMTKEIATLRETLGQTTEIPTEMA